MACPWRACRCAAGLDSGNAREYAWAAGACLPLGVLPLGVLAKWEAWIDLRAHQRAATQAASVGPRAQAQLADLLRRRSAADAQALSLRKAEVAEGLFRRERLRAQELQAQVLRATPWMCGFGAWHGNQAHIAGP